MTRNFIRLIILLSLFTIRLAAQAKFEPPAGCYIGAFIQNDPLLHSVQYPYGDAARFESSTAKHATYLTYCGYGQPFPSDLVRYYNGRNAIIQIGFEPNSGLGVVKDSSYLRDWARAARKSGAMIFLRWASEMNGNWAPWHGDTALYIEKWKVVWRVMKEEAPNVAMVWTPNDVPDVQGSPADNPYSYYPGDGYVDWVGIDFYCVYYSDDGSPERVDPRTKLRVVYDRYASRKPVMISEWGVAHDTNRGDTTGIQRYAVSYLDSLYAHLASEFPRVKSVTYFDYDRKNAGTNTAPPDTILWNLTADSVVLSAYAREVRLPGFTGVPFRNVPVVALAGLPPDTVLRSDVEITASVLSDAGIDSVVLSIDSIPCSSAVSGPYAFIVNPAQLTEGRHVARVTAYAEGGYAGFDETSFVSDTANEYVNIVIDNSDAAFSTTGTWAPSTSQPDRYGADYRFTYGGDGKSRATWHPAIPRSGRYNVYAWWSVSANRATNAPYTVYSANDPVTVRVNQQLNGGQWNLLGTFSLTAGDSDSLTLTNAATQSSVVVADAARFEWAFAPTNVREHPREIPAAIALEQNFPNPFNPLTTIRYTLAGDGLVSLRIYDILGREVAAPLNHMHQRAGVHSIQFQASSLASGVYFYRLITGRGVLTRRMTLLK